MLNLTKKKKPKSRNLIIRNNVESSYSKSNNFDYENDFHRQDLIVNHRKIKQKLSNLLSSKNNYKTSKSSITRQKRIIQNFTNLSKIYLSNIDMTFDHIEKGKYLLVAIIDTPNLNFTSLMTVIEDEENNVERLAIYNLTESNSKKLEKFRIGTVLKIMNPYLRIANDGLSIIRIDDINSFQIIEYIENPCNLCLRCDSSNICNKCNNSVYCSNQCQIIDWNIYKHAFTCGEIIKEETTLFPKWIIYFPIILYLIYYFMMK